MAFTLGCSSLALPLFGPGARAAEEVLDAAFAEGPYQVLELHLSEPLGAPEAGRVIPLAMRRQVEAVARGARERGAGVLLGLGGRFLLGPTKHEPSLIHPDAEGRRLRLRLLQEALALAEELGVDRLVFLSGPSPLAAAPDKHATPAWRWLEEGLEALLAQAEARRITLSPEAHSLHLLADVEDVRRLQARLPSPKTAGESVGEWVLLDERQQLGVPAHPGHRTGPVHLPGRQLASVHRAVVLSG